MMATPDFTWNLPGDLAGKVGARTADLRTRAVVRRMWEHDPSVWSGTSEDRWLGWLTLPSDVRPAAEGLIQFAREVRAEEVQDIVLLGMGGSSLAPDVFRSVVGREQGFPNLHVLDSTDPGQIRSIELAVDLPRTLFVVASKSGGTLEVDILQRHFLDTAVRRLGAENAGRHFVLTTDPGSRLHQVAREAGFRKVFEGVPSVGGRYSALSNFGLVPAALIGVDVATLLDRANVMAERCASDGPDNAAFELGVILGELALAGRDKPTLITPPALASFGSWLEQLVAESLGKQGKGIIPIDGEMPGSPDVYGSDRVFVHLRSAAAPDAATDAIVERLEREGHPMLRIDWPDRYALGAEFYRWEFATAIAGAVLGVNPFDQPDVEATKVVTRRLAGEYETTGTLPGDERQSNMAAVVALLNQLQDGDYFALLAFIQMNEANRNALSAIRTLVRDRKRVATSIGFGPRYLHSTGQAHKGGPNSGVFLLLTCDDAEDLPVPGQKYTFGTIKLAQALGDFEVLAARGRRVLRLHLKDVDSGLRELHDVIQTSI